MRMTKCKLAGTWVDLAFWPYVSILTGAMSRRLALCLGIMVCLSLTGGVRLLMLVPLLQLVGLDVQERTVGRIAQFLSSTFILVGLPPTLITVLGIYMLIISVQGFLYRGQVTTPTSPLGTTSWLLFASDFTGPSPILTGYFFPESDPLTLPMS